MTKNSTDRPSTEETCGLGTAATATIPVAENKHTSYENFTADCPICGHENIFNRASDLRTFEPIAGRDVACLNAACGKPFRIIGDMVNAPHEMLLYDAGDLLRRKQYMNCILTVATAYEVMFSLFLRAELLYRPFASVAESGYDSLNRLSEALHRRIERHTFERMRALFLQQVIARPPPGTLHEAERIIASLPSNPRTPDDAAIDSLPEPALVPLLKKLKEAKIGALRNRVVHKQAYRPTREETEAAVEEARSTILPLTFQLELHDNVNMYVMLRERGRRGGDRAGLAAKRPPAATGQT